MNTKNIKRSIAKKALAYNPENKKAVFSLPMANTGYTFASLSEIQILEAYKLK